MKLRDLTIGALVASLYVILTFVFIPTSFTAVQFRVSEALCIMPVFTPIAIPALFVGCLLSNLLSLNLIDIIFGSIATLIAAFLTRKLRGNIFLAVLPPIFVNGLIVGLYLGILSGGNYGNILFNILTVTTGQAGVMFLLGIPLYYLLKPYMSKILKDDYWSS